MRVLFNVIIVGIIVFPGMNVSAVNYNFGKGKPRQNVRILEEKGSSYNPIGFESSSVLSGQRRLSSERSALLVSKKLTGTYAIIARSSTLSPSVSLNTSSLEINDFHRISHSSQMIDSYNIESGDVINPLFATNSLRRGPARLPGDPEEPWIPVRDCFWLLFLFAGAWIGYRYVFKQK